MWTFLEGDEYNSARDSANIFNRNMRAADPYYANNGLEIHEIEPVKMGGSPTDINNKTAIQSQVHRRYVTPWWNKIRDEVKKDWTNEMNIQEIIKTIKTNESIGLSEKDITDFEKEINWHFPTDYREILMAVDGGYVK